MKCCHEHNDQNCDLTEPVQGLRVKERVVKDVLDDGSKQCMHETYEEVVPMRLSKRVIRKVADVPIEEKVEVFGEDGSIDTTVRTLSPDQLDLDHQPTTLESIESELHALRNDMQGARTCKSKPAKKHMFMKKAQTRYGGAPAEQEIQVSTGSKGELLITAISWAVFAIAAGLLTYMVIT